MQKEVQLIINSLGKLHIGINELIANINKTNEINIQPVEGPVSLGANSSKITEIGAYLKYDIVGNNNLGGCCKAFQEIIAIYYPDKNESEIFYKKIEKRYNEYNN